MQLILWVVMLPFFVWVWWGMAFIIAKGLIEYVTYVVTKENIMSERHRLIRYVDKLDAARPVLSRYDDERKLQQIDRDLASFLPVVMRQHLEMSVIPETMLSRDGMSFVPFQ